MSSTGNEERRSLIDDDAAQHIIYNEPKSIDSILSKELLQLSLNDRNKINEEIHGVSNLAPRESPEFLEESLQELSIELNKIPDDLKAAYIESQIHSETYTNTADFRLRFLRCELFDAKKAATRMVRYLEFASDFFGPEVLQRPMKLSDLTEEEAESMTNESPVILTFRDRSGRPVFVSQDFNLLSKDFNLRSMGRQIFFKYASVIEDIESQQKGIVLIFYASKESLNTSSNLPEWEKFKFMKRLDTAIPLRVAATHFCLPNTPYFHAIQAAYSILSSMHKSIQFHVGEEVEQLYSLKTYGIPAEVLQTENAKKTFLHQWLRGRRVAEESHDKSIVLYPASNDVLYRRGASLTSHPGNLMCRDCIESRMHAHSVASQTKKREITASIVDTIKQRGGRFLEWNKGGWWVEIKESSLVHRKVANQVKLFKFKPSTATAQLVRSSTLLFQNQDHAKAKRRKITHDTSSSDSEGSKDCTCFF